MGTGTTACQNTSYVAASLRWQSVIDDLQEPIFIETVGTMCTNKSMQWAKGRQESARMGCYVVPTSMSPSKGFCIQAVAGSHVPCSQASAKRLRSRRSRQDLTFIPYMFL